MPRIIPFRKRRWRPARRDRAPKPLRFWPDERKQVTFRGLVRDTIFWLRPVMLAAGTVILWPAMDPALVEPPKFLSTDPEHVSATFTRCGPGRGHACVIDGDTFKIGERKVRIIGIDAPETHPSRCPEEARLAELATAKLQELLNQAPFEMVGRFDDMHDRYGRDLRAIQRKRPNGATQSIADDMRASGLAHRYVGFKIGWC